MIFATTNTPASRVRVGWQGFGLTDPICFSPQIHSSAVSFAVKDPCLTMEESIFVDFDAAVDVSFIKMDNYRRSRGAEMDKMKALSLGTGYFPTHGAVRFFPSPAPSVCSRTEASEYSMSDRDDLEEEMFDDDAMDYIKRREHSTWKVTHRSSQSTSSFVPPLLKEVTRKAERVVVKAEKMVIKAEKSVEFLMERTVEQAEKLVSKAEKRVEFMVERWKHEHDRPKLERQSSSFMRVSDLNLDAVISSMPPSGVKSDANEWWMELAVGSREVQDVVKTLVNVGLATIFDDKMWIPDKKTEKLLEDRSSRLKHGLPLVMNSEGTPQDTTVLMWNGKFYHAYFGHDIPAIKSSGIVAMNATDLLELLLDNSRIQEYNKISQGRMDELVYSDDLHTNGITKVVRSKSKPPIVTKPLEFVSLMHAQELRPEDGHGEGYLIVTRGVTLANEKRDPSASEILLNVSLIRKIDGFDGKCEMINVNHVSSPMIPLFVVKKLGYRGAVSFINDLRALCK